MTQFECKCIFSNYSYLGKTGSLTKIIDVQLLKAQHFLYIDAVKNNFEVALYWLPSHMQNNDKNVKKVLYMFAVFKRVRRQYVFWRER